MGKSLESNLPASGKSSEAAALVDSLSAISWGILSHNCLPKLLPDSCNFLIVTNQISGFLKTVWEGRRAQESLYKGYKKTFNFIGINVSTSPC